MLTSASSTRGGNVRPFRLSSTAAFLLVLSGILVITYLGYLHPDPRATYTDAFVRVVQAPIDSAKVAAASAPSSSSSASSSSSSSSPAFEASTNAAASNAKRPGTAIAPVIPDTMLPRSPSGLPIANYAIVIDAGSSGSRIYVYQYKVPKMKVSSSTTALRNALSTAHNGNNNAAGAGVGVGVGAAGANADRTVHTSSFSTGSAATAGTGTAGEGEGDPTADLLHVAVAEDDQHRYIIKKQEPGLSSYADSPADAFSSIKPLLDFAANHIPKELIPRTPVYILGTAGLRLIPVEKKDAILSAIRRNLRELSDAGGFLFDNDEQATVISGETEGLYGWIALNYVLNRFGDLNGTYPTGGLDPHTYTVMPRPLPHSWYSTTTTTKPTTTTSMSTSTSTTGTGTAVAAAAGTGAAGENEPAPPRSVGLVELGGGSAQIAFEALDDGDDDPDNDPEHPSEFVFRVDLDLTACQPAVERITAEKARQLRSRDRADSLTASSSSSSSSSSPTPSASSAAAASSLAGATTGVADKNKQEVPITSSKAVIGKSNKEVVLSRKGRGVGRGGHVYDVYSASFLGYGANSARERYVNSIIDKHVAANRKNRVIGDPCLLKYQRQIVTKNSPWGRNVPLTATSAREHPPLDESGGFTLPADTSITLDDARGEFMLEGLGDWAACRKAMVPLLDKKTRCPWRCPFGGRYQPVLTPEVLTQQFYAFSEYWYTTRDVLDLKPEDFTAEKFAKASHELCSADVNDFHDVFDKFQKKQFNKNANEDRIRQQCFKSAWLDAILYEGHEFPRNLKETSLLPVSSIEGTEVQWALGALITLITDRVKRDQALCRRLNTDDGLTDVKLKARNSLLLTKQPAVSANDILAPAATAASAGAGATNGGGNGSDKALGISTARYANRNYAPEATSDVYHPNKVDIPAVGSQPLSGWVWVAVLAVVVLAVKGFYGSANQSPTSLLPTSRRDDRQR